MVLTFIALGAFASTMIGGLLALGFRDKLHLVLGYSAGAIIGVAFFDLLPEAIELAQTEYSISTITACVALGFVMFMIIDRFVAPHHHGEDHCENENHRGKLGAGSLSFHSLLDGLAIGLSFQVSMSVGLIVTMAVLVHDFSDGINTVGLVLKNGGTRIQALKWLTVDALAPVIGLIISLFLTFTESMLGIILALFCGFFLYLGASDLLPESHHQHPTLWTTFMTILGVLTLYIAITIAGI